MELKNEIFSIELKFLESTSLKCKLGKQQGILLRNIPTKLRFENSANKKMLK